MDYDVEKLNRMFKTMTARKISILSRLAGLNDEEISIMRMRWLDNLSDVQICEKLCISSATLTRKRKIGYCKIVDALELYGLDDNDNLPAQEILDYNGRFYEAQDNLIRYFLIHRTVEEQDKIVSVIKSMIDS